MHMEENGENLVETFESSLLNDDNQDLFFEWGTRSQQDAQSSETILGRQLG